MGTKIANSVIVASTSPSTDFSVTGNFEIIVKEGRVTLETKVDGNYYKVTDISRFPTGIIFSTGTSIKLTSIEATRVYRIVPIGTATAEAWQLT